MRNVINLFSLVVCLSLAGCASAKIESVKDEKSVRKLSKVFVVINHGTMEDNFSQMLASNLEKQFKDLNTNVKIMTVNKLELDEGKYTSEMKKFGPEAVLSVAATHGVYDYTGNNRIEYDVSLFPPEGKSRWWRAKLTNSGGSAMMKTRMEKAAAETINRLKQDGFL